MIEKKLLYKLGYTLKTRLLNGSSDFTHSDSNRPYLVNFNEGKVSIVFPITEKQDGLKFDDPETFEKWHHKYL